VRPVNLLPREHRRAARAERPGSAYAVLGVLGVLLVMAIAYVTVANQVKQHTGDANSAAAEADQLEAQAQQLGSFTNFAQIQQTRLASVATVASSRFDWERLMRELSRIMPERSWLQTADASTTTETDTTAAPTAAGVGTPTGPTATLVGCTPRQSDVARMMVRLRQMNRVDDVQLNESVREASGDTKATVDNCGGFYKFDLTVSFAAATPTQEAPRGSARVPAALGGGS
jgi:Tfp pilus assembly protein PilN